MDVAQNAKSSLPVSLITLDPENPPNPIEALAAPLQKLPPDLRWLYSQAGIIVAAATGHHSPPGKRAAQVDRLLGFCERAGFPLAATASATLILLFAVFLRQGRAPTHKPIRRLFTGISSLRDPMLARQFKTMMQEPVTVVDERFLPSFYALRRVGIAALFGEWRQVWKILYPKLASSPQAHVPSQRLLLNHLVRHGHRYIYLRAWFRALLSDGACSPVMGFSAASLVSYAAIAAGGTAIYLPHGFQAQSLVYPDFAEVECFNRFEADHFRKRLPHAIVRLTSQSARFVQPTDAVAIAGVNHGEENYGFCETLIAWAKGLGLPVIVRPHPNDRSGYWERWRGVDGVAFAEERSDFDSFLSNYRPRFLASWHSTALFDAVVRGIVPITFHGDDRLAADVVFPFRRIALRWPEQQPMVRDLLHSSKTYERFVADNYADVFGQAV